MNRIRLALIAAALALVLSGCGVGLIYTHTVQPLSRDMHGTRVVQTDKTGSIKHLVLYYGPLSVAWDEAGIGDIAKKNGLQTVYSADIETLKVLGIWNQYTVHVYGR